MRFLFNEQTKRLLSRNKAGQMRLDLQRGGHENNEIYSSEVLMAKGNGRWKQTQRNIQRRQAYESKKSIILFMFLESPACSWRLDPLYQHQKTVEVLP